MRVKLEFPPLPLLWQIRHLRSGLSSAACPCWRQDRPIEVMCRYFFVSSSTAFPVALAALLTALPAAFAALPTALPASCAAHLTFFPADYAASDTFSDVVFSSHILHIAFLLIRLKVVEPLLLAAEEGAAGSYYLLV